MSHELATTAAAVVLKNGTIRVEQRPVPPVGVGQILVRTQAVAICPNEAAPKSPFAPAAPFVPGHELVGVVSDAGVGVANLRPGDLVYVQHHTPCGRCRRCRRLRPERCQTLDEPALAPGGLAGLVRVAENAITGDVVQLPAAVPPAEALLLGPLANALKSLRRGYLKPGDHVLVVGLDGPGLLHVNAARFLGAEHILTAHRDAGPQRKARRAGAHGFINLETQDLAARVRKLTDRDGVDLVVLGAGSEDRLDAALAATAPGGAIIVSTGLAPRPLPALPPEALVTRGIKLLASSGNGPTDVREALDLFLKDRPNRGDHLGPVFPFDQVAEAFAAVRAAPAAGEMVVVAMAGN